MVHIYQGKKGTFFTKILSYRLRSKNILVSCNSVWLYNWQSTNKLHSHIFHLDTKLLKSDEGESSCLLTAHMWFSSWLVLKIVDFIVTSHFTLRKYYCNNSCRNWVVDVQYGLHLSEDLTSVHNVTAILISYLCVLSVLD